MKRLNFTLDQHTIDLLEELSTSYYEGNKSQTVRAALESLAAHTGHDGWVITGYTPTRVQDDVSCHSCSTTYHRGDVLFRPVFERGQSPYALDRIPKESWLDCPDCAERQLAD